MTTGLLGETRYVTDGGLETDLIFHHGADLPEFASFPLLETDTGRDLLTAYFRAYADIARRADAGWLIESCTWRANPDWGARLGYDAAALARANTEAIELLHRLRDDERIETTLVGGTIGPRGDGYVPGERLSPEEYADHHRPQIAAFRRAGADLATAYTLTGTDEAIGVVTAARAEGMPVAISFTVETDGRLPDGTAVGEAIDQVDAQAPPDWFLLNCAHPAHVAAGLAEDGGRLPDRVRGLRPNASRLSHAELDEAEELDEGDLDDLRTTYLALGREAQLLGGCCGTDVRHVARLWGV